MAELIEALLFLARDEAQEIGPEHTTCRADSVVTEVIDAYRPIQGNSHIDTHTLERCEVRHVGVGLHLEQIAARGALGVAQRAVGERSAMAVDIANHGGVEGCAHIPGGFVAWTEAGSAAR